MEISIDFNKAPSKGDVIWAIRLPFHCGIYEDDDSVIHFAPLDDSKTKANAVIHKSSLEEFSNGSPYIVIEFSSEKCLSPEETIQRARSRLGENTYNLFLNNCDHFATWCKIGEHRSLQVDLAKNILVEAGKYIDKSGKKDTAFETGAEIFCLIYKIAEIFTSSEFKKMLPPN
jgi:hypothetical protein